MHAVVVALGGCKFEATNPWHDQAVLTRILQTLEACIACPSGRLLSNTDACAVFQAVYRIGFDTQVVQELSGAFLALRHDMSSCTIHYVQVSWLWNVLYLLALFLGQYCG